MIDKIEPTNKAMGMAVLIVTPRKNNFTASGQRVQVIFSSQVFIRLFDNLGQFGDTG